jgi:hypothetical protein
VLKILLTVFLACKKGIFQKKKIDISKRPLKQNLALISKLVSKSSIKYQKVMIFGIGISGGMARQIFKVVL